MQKVISSVATITVIAAILGSGYLAAATHRHKVSLKINGVRVHSSRTVVKTPTVVKTVKCLCGPGCLCGANCPCD